MRADATCSCVSRVIDGSRPRADGASNGGGGGITAAAWTRLKPVGGAGGKSVAIGGAIC